MKQVLNALTGERPKPVPDTSQPDTEPSAAADGTAGGAGDGAAGGAGEPTAKPHVADKGETPKARPTTPPDCAERRRSCQQRAVRYTVR